MKKQIRLLLPVMLLVSVQVKTGEEPSKKKGFRDYDNVWDWLKSKQTKGPNKNLGFWDYDNVWDWWKGKPIEEQKQALENLETVPKSNAPQSTEMISVVTPENIPIVTPETIVVDESTVIPPVNPSENNVANKENLTASDAGQGILKALSPDDKAKGLLGISLGNKVWNKMVENRGKLGGLAAAAGVGYGICLQRAVDAKVG